MSSVHNNDSVRKLSSIFANIISIVSSVSHSRLQKRYILRHLLACKLPEDYGLDVNRWWKEFCQIVTPWTLPIERAIIGGFHSSCLGFAFVSGYQAALEKLISKGS